MEKRKYFQLSTSRIEAFSDGVFAIAITLLVLEIKVPHLEGAEQSLGAALLHLWSSYFGYVFSFIMIGIYWVNHHFIFHLYKRTDHYFLLLNVLFLMFISFLPFPTAVLAEYIDKEDPSRQTAIVFYTFGLFLPALGWCLMWLYASYKHRLIEKNLAPKFVSRMNWQYILSLVLYGSGMAVAAWNGTAGLIFCVCFTGLYLVEPRKSEYVGEEKND